MANTHVFNAWVNRKQKKPDNNNPLAGLTFSDFGMSAPQISTGNSAVIRSESLSEDRQRVSRTETPVPVASLHGQRGSVNESPLSAEIPEVLEPLRYHGDEPCASEKSKEPAERVGREKSVRSLHSVLFVQRLI